MATSGMIYTFGDTTITMKRTVSDLIKNIDPQDVPMIALLGLNNQGKFRIQNWGNNKYEWLEDTLKVRTATLAETMDTTETGMDVVTGTGIRFKIGDVWKFDETGEYILVSSISTDTITVIRAWNGNGGTEGTATVGVTNATTLTYLYNARLEGADSDASFSTVPTSPYNYTQIFQQEIKVTGSEEKSARYGISDQYKYQLMKWLGGGRSDNGVKAGDLMLDLENTFFYGTRKLRTATVPGAMGGFKTYVTTNVTANASARLTQAVLENSIQSCWSYGGRPQTIVCNAFNKRLISSWFAPSIRTQRTENTGGNVIDNIETEFGVFDLRLNRHCPSSEVDILDKNLMGWCTLRDWFVHPLGISGDYVKDELLGEFGFVLQMEKSHAVITGTAIS